MIKHFRLATFVGYEEVKLCKTGDYHRYDLYIDTEELEFGRHDNLYLSPAMNKADYILLLIYDFELTESDGIRPCKVIYTDFYFKGLTKGIMEY